MRTFYRAEAYGHTITATSIEALIQQFDLWFMTKKRARIGLRIRPVRQ